ncbi:MAG TPA: putative manganese-dependent inorganic diphosphatase [Firmicutes bacterium]|jgi:manganese-dependent inorganic pyrophosphatase|nr:putative manganese-dependent inorganic diphosphatase [Bacillota bacterium]
MTEKVFIIGHQNPDTDSICSAIAYANLKQQMNVDAIPVRIGRINQETAFVLDYFGINPPEYLATVKTQVSNLKMDTIEPISSKISLKEAWEIIKANNIEVLPVENNEHQLVGVVSISDIANAYMNMPENNSLSVSHTPLENVARTLNANILYGMDRVFSNSGKTIIAAMTPEEMGSYMETGDIVFVGNRRENQLKAIEAGAFCIIVTCGSEVEKEIANKAHKKGCILLVTEYDTFTAARLLYQSIPVGFIMTSKNLVAFQQDDYIDTVKEQMLQTRYRSYPVVDNNGRFKGFISRYHLIKQNRNKVILVDHSESSQTINGIEQAEILEIIDHHRIGDIQTGRPIYYRNQPVGSTATIVANLFFENGIQPSEKIAGILCAAILSDTVAFKSSTSTDTDINTAKKLAEMSHIDIDKFAKKMFQAGSSLKNMSSDEILQNDFKEYLISKNKVGVGQINTEDLSSVKKIRSSILESMKALLVKEGYSMILLLITDILNEETEILFVETHQGMIAKAFNPLKDENSFVMKGVVSRKNQIIPELTNILSDR